MQIANFLSCITNMYVNSFDKNYFSYLFQNVMHLLPCWHAFGIHLC